MRPSSLQRKGLSAVAGGLLLVSGTPVTFAGDGPASLQVLGGKLVGDLLEVGLYYPGPGVLSGKLVLEVILGGVKTLAVMPFQVWGGQKVFVHGVSMDPAESKKPIPLGVIVDDDAPI